MKNANKNNPVNTVDHTNSDVLMYHLEAHTFFHCVKHFSCPHSVNRVFFFLLSFFTKQEIVLKLKI